MALELPCLVVYPPYGRQVRPSGSDLVAATVTLPAVWLMPDVKRDHLDSPHRLTWDGAIIERFLDELGAAHLVGFDALVDGEGAVVVVPGAYYAQRVDWINERLARLPWAVVLVYADEGATFPDADLKHENMTVWRQAPRRGTHTGTRFLPMGAPPETHETLADLGHHDRCYDWSFSGQVNHDRRRDCVAELWNLSERPGEKHLLNQSRGFGRGLPRREYLRTLAESKAVACPAGIKSADSFRVWESLAAGAVPVVDASCPEYDQGFWTMLFNGPPPFPTVEQWGDFAAAVDDIKADWPAGANRVNARWQRWLRDTKWRIADDIADASGSGRRSRGNITVLIPTSPIPSHPGTEVIETTVDSVRHHLPDAEIIVMCDGVRPEQEHYRPQYEQYLHNMLCLSANRWGASVPVIHDEHAHQANMTRAALELVRTPLVLFVEHDTPLTADLPIDWAKCEQVILGDVLDVVRFHFEAQIPQAHARLMLDRAPKNIGGLQVVRTRQWSQRPHLARTSYYRRIIRDWFPPTCNTMIEDKMHGVCQDERWAKNRLAVYAEDPANLKRSWTTDGRQGEPKFEELMRFE